MAAEGYIDQLCIKIGFDPGELRQGLQQVQMVIESVNSEVKDFGEGLAEGLTAAETGADQAAAAVAVITEEAKAAGEEMEKTGDKGETGTKKIEKGARKAGQEVSFLEKKVGGLGRRLGKMAGRAVFGFAAAVVAPLMGAMAISGMIGKYTDDLKRLDELSRKRNLGLKERQERQKLLNEYSEKDLKVYRQSNAAFEEFKKVLGGAGQGIMRTLLPALALMAKGLTAVGKFVKEHGVVLLPLLTALAGVVMAKLVPAFWAWAAAMLANPITWLILLLVGLGLLLEDMWVHVNGGESAFAGLWDWIAQGGDIIYDLVEWFKNLGSRLKEFGTSVADSFVEAFNQLRDAAVAIFMQVGEFIKGMFDGIVNFIKQKIASLISAIPDFLMPESLKSWADDVKAAVSGAAVEVSQNLPQLAEVSQGLQTQLAPAYANAGAAVARPGAVAGQVDNSSRSVNVQSSVTINAPNSDPQGIAGAWEGAWQRTTAETVNTGINQ